MNGTNDDICSPESDTEKKQMRDFLLKARKLLNDYKEDEFNEDKFEEDLAQSKKTRYDLRCDFNTVTIASTSKGSFTMDEIVDLAKLAISLPRVLTTSFSDEDIDYLPDDREILIFCMQDFYIYFQRRKDADEFIRKFYNLSYNEAKSKGLVITFKSSKSVYCSLSSLYEHKQFLEHFEQQIEVDSDKADKVKEN